LVEGDSESTEIVTESLADELKKDNELSQKIENSKGRMGVAAEATFHIVPAILKFLSSLVLTSQREEQEPVRIEKSA
jgi:hypothetical protein